MSTNFYTEDGKHIGKRSMAGKFCHDCGVSACDNAYDSLQNRDIYGAWAVHYASAKFLYRCPICGKDLTESYTCSFSFAMKPKDLQAYLDSGGLVEDEYKRMYSREQFSEEIKGCGIKYYHSVGLDFS